MAKSSVLYAAAKEIGATCEAENLAFLACKEKDENPKACLESGSRVQDCALGVLKSAMDSCGEALSSYASCIDKQSSQEYMFDRCRREETAFRSCRKEGGSSSVVAADPLEVKSTDPAADTTGRK